MNTEPILLYNTSYYYLTLFVVIMLTCISCSESAIIEPDSQSLDEDYLKFRVLAEEYWVDPEGTTIDALNGSVILEFPEGAVNEPTLFTLSSFPIHCLERKGYHLMDRGFSITNESAYGLPNSSWYHYVKIKIHLDSDILSGLKNTKEPDITIFYLNDYQCLKERIELMCKCIGDDSGHSVHGCLYCCGTYVIGES